MGFVQTISILELLRLIPQVGPLVLTFVTLLSICAATLAVAEAHRLRGWKTILLPILYFALIILGAWALSNMSEGFAFALESLGQRFGISP